MDGIIKSGSISTNDYNALDYDTIKSNLKKAVKDEKVKAIIIKIDSPGGDAALSMSIATMINKIKKKKPVIALCGNIVASGGYLIASFADKIIANKLSLIGSIG